MVPHCLVMILVVIPAALALVLAQDAKFSVDDEGGRPLWQAIQKLEPQKGWEISYEDLVFDPEDYGGSPPKIEPGEAHKKMTAQEKAALEAWRQAIARYFFLRPARLEIGITGAESKQELFQKLIDDHAQRKNPGGQFELREVDGRTAIVPVRGTILDKPVPLELPREGVTLDEFLGIFAKPLVDTTGITISSFRRS